MSHAAACTLAPLLTPQGHLRLAPDADAPPLPVALHDRLAAAFAADTGHGLLQLGASEVGCALPPALAWWRDFAVRYMTGLCATPEGGEIAVAVPDAPALDALIADLPPMTGSEYLTPDVLVNAPTESWFNSFKNEWVHGLRFETHEEMIAMSFEYIEVFYNRKRLHSTLGYDLPDFFKPNCGWRLPDFSRSIISYRIKQLIVTVRMVVFAHEPDERKRSFRQAADALAQRCRDRHCQPDTGGTRIQPALCGQAGHRAGRAQVDRRGSHPGGR